MNDLDVNAELESARMGNGDSRPEPDWDEVRQTLNGHELGGESAHEIAARVAREAHERAGVKVDFSELDRLRISLAEEPEKPETVFSLMNQSLCTAGNLTVIAAQPKAGKSATVGAMLGAVLQADAGRTGGDTFGFRACPTEGRAIIFLDTEQSRYDAWANLARAADRVGCAVPDNLRAYAIKDLRHEVRRAWLEAELKRASEDCGGIHSVFLDGVADLLLSVNDEAEAMRLAEDLHILAGQYDCPLVCVLHENPGSETFKTRGHLGSQLERKSESNLRLDQNADGVVTIYSARGCRHACFPKAQGPQFAWDPEAGMHLSVTRSPEDAAQRKREEQGLVVEAVYQNVVGGLNYSELCEALKGVTGQSQATAERRITQWQKLGLIKKTKSGNYVQPV